MVKQHIPGPEENDGETPGATNRLFSNESRSKKLLVPRLLVSLISLTMVGLGIMAFLTQHYYGRTSKLGGAEVSLNGGPAVSMGLATVFFGLLPLALWFPSKRPALAWALACAAAAAVSFYISAYGAKP